MGVKFKTGKVSPLLPDEKVLYERSTFRLMTSSSHPSYKIAFNLPLIMTMKLIITDRRCLVIGKLFTFITSIADVWYPGRNPEGETEIITEVSTGKGLFGKCLVIKSRDPNRPRQWMCSPNMTARFYFPDPDRVEQIIKGAMNHLNHE